MATSGHVLVRPLRASDTGLVRPFRVSDGLSRNHRTRYRTKHHYLLRVDKDESLRLRRLGSGLLGVAELDSTILTHLVVGHQRQTSHYLMVGLTGGW